MVRPISPTTPARVVTFLFSLEIKKAMYAEVASCGTCRVIEMITQRTVPPMRISGLTLRSCDGASSRRSHCRESTGENRGNRGAPLDSRSEEHTSELQSLRHL